MRRKQQFPSLFLIGFLFFLLILPSSFMAKVRSFVIGGAAPFWETVHIGKNHSSENMQLALENQRIHLALEEVYDWLLAEKETEEQTEELKNLANLEEKESEKKDFLLRRKQEMQKRIELQLQSLPAKIIFRDPLSWSSSIWINVGERENKAIGKKIVAIHSPVVVGNALVGVVEEVKKTRSRVRLITDSGIGVAVRAIRGVTQERLFYNRMTSLLPMLKEREDLFSSVEEKENFLKFFSRTSEKLLEKKQEWFLAKGVLEGKSLPLWSLGSQKLIGKGFNYNFADREGEARDLKTGKILKKASEEKIPLLCENDLLVTSGMDGIFPAGFFVANVTKVMPLTEGAFAYELEATPVVEDLEDLQMVFVLPPLEEKEQ